ncbi:MAG: M24 family metallopeptidase [Lachnotalea sp.]
MKNERVSNVLKKMKEIQLSQFLICDPLSIYYLTGTYIDPGERFYALCLNENGKHMIFINELFIVPEELGIEKIWYSDISPIMDIVAKRMDYTKVLGVDKNLPARFLLPLQEKKAAIGFVQGSECIDKTRGCKDVSEQEKMKTVSKINDLAMAEFKKLIIQGVTEKQMAEQMLTIYKNLGAENYSFEPLVAFGANAAEGHHIPNDTVLKAGDSVLLDVGCFKDMYCSDMTRTFFYKEVSKEHRKIYELVKKANEAAIAELKPGMKLKEVDKIARNIINEAGYGPNFTHRLGHFIGLEVHEFGNVSSDNDELVEPGMIFSIEPGIYLEGNMGVRIEDLVLITEDGNIRLNQYTKELEIVS